MKKANDQPATPQAHNSWRELPHVPVSRPMLGSIGATGEWRTFKPEFDMDACNKRGLCYLYCPDGVVKYKDDTLPEIDYLYCKGCGICAAVCPKEALQMVREDK